MNTQLRHFEMQCGGREVATISVYPPGLAVPSGSTQTKVKGPSPVSVDHRRQEEANTLLAVGFLLAGGRKEVALAGARQVPGGPKTGARNG